MNRVLTLLFLLFSSAAFASEDQLSASEQAFFENHIRPVLVQQCYECHSQEAEDIGGNLLLDHRQGLIQGGESGTALNLENPEQSLLLAALRWEHDLEMPPEEPLDGATIQRFQEWVAMGAPDPRSGKPVQLAGKEYDEEALWSFQPIIEPELPASTSWPRTELDRFVEAARQDAGLLPNRDASAGVLIRRLHQDLIGLPPTLDEVRTFEQKFAGDRDGALEALVDSLLDSPHFGERWGRHWLDVARYAESNGNDGLSRNPTFPHAWRYRDYVINAFNADVPYDRFLKEQIAGDLLPAESDAERDRHLVATGFLALGAKPAKAMNNNFDMDVVADQLDVIGRGVMGLSISCARCHDHKFDPIPTKDYYALAGIFTSTETMWGLAANEKLTAPVTDLHVLKAAESVLPPEDFVETVFVLESNTGKPKPIPDSKWPAGTPLAMGVRDKKEVADAKINQKGDAKKLGDAVPRGFLSATEFDAEFAIPADQSGRLQLAEWLTHPDHPQTARVMANRVWLHLFGEGLVRTPDDFGVYGDRPTHPELLDHLAQRFMAHDWSVKALIREIVLSRTYQLDSTPDAVLHKQDPENLWLSYHSRRRLDAESLRDRMLQVSGQLDLTPADGSIIRHRDILVNLAGNLQEPSRHRSVYLCYLRSFPPPELMAFDLPQFSSVIGQREETILPDQALYLFNHPSVKEQAEHLARLIQGHPGTLPQQVERLFRRVLLREPDAEELYRAEEMLKLDTAELGSSEKAWASLSQALILSNEFRYID